MYIFIISIYCDSIVIVNAFGHDNRVFSEQVVHPKEEYNILNTEYSTFDRLMSMCIPEVVFSPQRSGCLSLPFTCRSFCVFWRLG